MDSKSCLFGFLTLFGRRVQAYHIRAIEHYPPQIPNRYYNNLFNDSFQPRRPLSIALPEILLQLSVTSSHETIVR